MKAITMTDEIMETDVLVIGGGPAGLMAAIHASELGAKVIVVDKANTMRSGSGTSGNDHFRAYIPEFHGPDMEPVVKEVAKSQVGWTRPMSFVRTWMKTTSEIVRMWDRWGIPMKHEGRWEFAGHAFPGKPFSTLKYSGQNQKPILTKEAKKRGVKIVNRVTAFDLITDHGLSGAVGVHAREDKIITILAKAFVLCTGGCVRLYPGPTPGWMFNRADSPHTTGDGRAMAYRAGADLTNMEFPMRWAGPKYFARCGKATWVGVLRDPQDKPVGPFVTRPDRVYGDPISDSYKEVFEDYMKAGKGPVYMDCRGISDEDYDYMMHYMKHEALHGILNQIEEEGIDLKKNPIEFMTYEMTTRGGIYYNEKGETSLAGLYAAGDEYFGGISSASTFGWIAGGNAAGFAKTKEAPNAGNGKEKAEEVKNFVEEIRNRKAGPSWQEINVALNQVMLDYAGTTRSDTLLEAGASHLQRVKKKAMNDLMARNQHELMHCLEVFNLLDVAEVVFAAVSKRKETREKYSRIDYPYKNPTFDGKTLICRKGEKGPLIELRVMQD
ncbi:MAG: FAD-binding protein [Deltaproteobacteria bacterium]|nr:FAD-binding protein [Deltaproteobacteria bacterium]MBW1862660.1 FAD-binding protein [Deltaproteobacteria bacterium]